MDSSPATAKSRSWIRAQRLPNQDRGFGPRDCQIKIVDSSPGTAKSRSWFRAQGLPNQDRGFEPRTAKSRSWIRAQGLPNQDRGFEPKDFQIKDYKSGICCVSTKHTALRRKRGWLEIRITCPSEATCLLANSCFSGFAL